HPHDGASPPASSIVDRITLYISLSPYCELAQVGQAPHTAHSPCLASSERTSLTSQDKKANSSSQRKVGNSGYLGKIIAVTTGMSIISPIIRPGSATIAEVDNTLLVNVCPDWERKIAELNQS